MLVRLLEMGLAAITLIALAGCGTAPGPIGTSSTSGAAAAEKSILLSSTPASNSVVSAPVDELVLRFSPPARLLEVAVRTADTTMPTMITAVGEVERYSVPLSGLGPGSYTADWRASVGGTEHRGSIHFTVR